MSAQNKKVILGSLTVLGFLMLIWFLMTRNQSLVSTSADNTAGATPDFGGATYNIGQPAPYIANMSGLPGPIGFDGGQATGQLAPLPWIPTNQGSVNLGGKGDGCGCGCSGGGSGSCNNPTNTCLATNQGQAFNNSRVVMPDVFGMGLAGNNMLFSVPSNFESDYVM
jgi:hypothetical protein